MKVTLLAIGSRGDVQPLVALGLGLQAAGYEVDIATHPAFERMVREAGLGFHLVRVNPKEMIEGEAGQRALAGGKNPVRALRHFARMVSPILLPMSADCLAACRETDAILFAPLAFYAAPHIAEKLNLPAIALLLQPMHRTTTFPSYTSPTQRNLGPIVNRLTYRITENMYWWPYRSVVNQFRQKYLDLPPVPGWLNYLSRAEKYMPVVCGFSSSVLPKPPDWGDLVEVTGFWFLNQGTGWNPPADLVDFLRSGPPPVCIGFGSMATRKPVETTNAVLQALARTKQRGVLLTGWGGLAQPDLPENVFAAESLPHDWLFPQMAAVVHHAGAGTVAAALRAGVPSIGVPFFIDQPFWAQRIVDLGVGPRPVPRQKLSAERLATAIELAVGDKEMQKRAAALGERIRAEDGVARAVEAISRFLSRRPHRQSSYSEKRKAQ